MMFLRGLISRFPIILGKEMLQLIIWLIKQTTSKLLVLLLGGMNLGFVKVLLGLFLILLSDFKPLVIVALWGSFLVGGASQGIVLVGWRGWLSFSIPV